MQSIDSNKLMIEIQKLLKIQIVVSFSLSIFFVFLAINDGIEAAHVIYALLFIVLLPGSVLVFGGFVLLGNFLFGDISPELGFIKYIPFGLSILTIIFNIFIFFLIERILAGKK